MSRVYILFIVVCCLIAGGTIQAEESLEDISTYMEQISASSQAVDSQTLEEIAVLTCQILLNVPLIGVEESRQDIESLIDLRKELENHGGFLERLLALRIQDILDQVLFTEIARHAINLRGVSVEPPYNTSSVQVGTVRALLQKNGVPEGEFILYIEELDGKFARFCRAKNFHPDEISSGSAARLFPPELKEMRETIKPDLAITFKKMNADAIQDVLFVYSLLLIDQARDIRLISNMYLDIFEMNGLLPDRASFIATLEKKMSSHPPRRISDGLPNTSRDIRSGAGKHRSDFLKNYPFTLTAFFIPYFTKTTDVVERLESLSSRYPDGLRIDDVWKRKTGMWLELDK
ncbi:MAG: hypothetical protein GY801_18925 [bacterium]|nr:hypothetical protein [bacterium]